jgi:hypothetical protein
MSTLNVVEEVLRERKVPMVVKEIVEAAGERLPTKSRTPDTVVARDLSMDIKRRGEQSLFIRVAPGKYTLRELVADLPPRPPVLATGTIPPPMGEPSVIENGQNAPGLPDVPAAIAAAPELSPDLSPETASQ